MAVEKQSRKQPKNKIKSQPKGVSHKKPVGMMKSGYMPTTPTTSTTDTAKRGTAGKAAGTGRGTVQKSETIANRTKGRMKAKVRSNNKELATGAAKRAAKKATIKKAATFAASRVAGPIGIAAAAVDAVRLGSKLDKKSPKKKGPTGRNRTK
jgi:hypothetical protein